MTQGRFSPSLGRFAEAYEHSLQDEQSLQDLKEPLALFDMIVKESAQRCGDLDTPNFRKDALELATEVEVQLIEGEEPAARATLTRLLDLLDRGGKQDEALDRLGRSAERFSKRLEKQWDIKLSAANAVNARDLVAIFGQVISIVMEVAGSTVGTKIATRVDREIMGSGKGIPGGAA